MIFNDFKSLKKNLKKDFSKLKKIKLAILGDCSTQLISQALRGYGYEYGISLEIFDADFDQIKIQVFDTNSDLYNFKPDFIVLIFSSEKLINNFYKSDEKENFASNKVEEIKVIWNTINNNFKSNIINFNFYEINDSIFGNFSNKYDKSFLYQIRKINFNFMDLAISYNNVFILDICSLQNTFGRNFTHDYRLYISYKMVFNIDFLPIIAKNILDIIITIQGNTKKCIILDLDDTLWGGVIGDDGINGIQIGELGVGKVFSDFQSWLKQLKNRGIILAVCSKNTEEIAKEPFNLHHEMILKLEDFAVFIANWEDKPNNIKKIQSILNIGFDSIIFIDDNPFERNIVKTMIPDICVPDLPTDPSMYLDFLKSLNLFETVSISLEDYLRNKSYQNEIKRNDMQSILGSIKNYLKNLDMVCINKPFEAFFIPRIAQLTQRSNQFNLRTIRYDQKDIEVIMQSDKYFTKYFTLNDKFGDYGLIGLVILKKDEHHLFIDTLIMSCRVLKRTMEEFIFNNIVSIAKKNNLNQIIGEYIPTNKNLIVKDFYKDFGFEQKNNLWLLDVNKYIIKETFVISE
ncbi:MAG: HAD-IIIC family phosphatase [Candidatus Sericytochromatia bacterium]|nr:HAD-IIIC family phosphatase [Candidatus Sericytochromatia bacterium]